MLDRLRTKDKRHSCVGLKRPEFAERHLHSIIADQPMQDPENLVSNSNRTHAMYHSLQYRQKCSGKFGKHGFIAPQLVMMHARPLEFQMHSDIMICVWN